MTKNSSQHYVTQRRVQTAAQAVTAVDRYILRQLYKHPFLTPDQLRVLVTSNLEGSPALPSCSRTAINRRMARLRRAEIVTGHRPPALRGTAPFHYFLSELGAHLVAQEAGLSRAELGWSTDHVRGRLPALAHQVKANGFFIALLQYGQQAGHPGLREWQGEDQCVAEFQWRGRKIRIAPDGYGVYAVGEYEHHFFLEWDRGLGPARGLRSKAERYVWYYQSGAYLERYPTFPDVWIVTRTAGRQRQVASMLRALLERTSPSPTFLVAQADAVVRNLGGAIWTDPAREQPVTFMGLAAGERLT